MDAIERAAEVLRMFAIEPGPLDRLLDSYLKRHREIGSRQRRLIARAVYGVARWRRRIEGCLALAGMSRPAPRDLAEAYLRWHTCDDFERMRGSLALNPSLDGVDFDAVSPDRFPGGAAAYCSFPDFLYDILKSQYGEEGAASLALKLDEPLGPTLRVNSLRASRDEAMRRLDEDSVRAEPTARSPYGLRLSMRTNFRELRAFREGLVDVQDEASQLVSILASPSRGETVLDACAGAGGKSLMMAALMGDAGRIVASDPDRGKLRELARRARRAGAESITTVDVRGLGDDGRFDLVLIDAPCSGTGTLRRSPDIKWRTTPEGIAGHARAQRAILAEYARFVRRGGRLLYATCSVLRDENEAVIEDFLSRGGFEVMGARGVLDDRGIDAGGIVTDGGFLKTDPREGEWDGFFAALLRRV